MRKVVWVAPGTLLALHEVSLARFGGTTGIREGGLWESAWHPPQQALAYKEKDLFVLAARLGAGLIKNHPFLDGNKRTGFLAAALFLEINGERFEATEEEVVLRTLALAAGAEGEAEFAEWLRASCRKKRKKRPTDPGASAPE